MTICIRKNDAEQLLSLFRESNSDVIPLHVAENILLFDRLDGIFTTDPSLALEDIKYQSSYGELDLRTEIAAFLSRSFSLEQSPLTAEQVSCFSSTRCALESAARALFTDLGVAGRDVLIPTPHWQGFNWIYQDQLGGQIIPVPLYPDDFALTLNAIATAYNEASDPKPGALILTNPHNPLGINYEQSLLEDIYNWVLTSTEMHIFSDEIYAHCQMEGIPASSFVSALALPQASTNPDRIHVAWGFAKDFGLSGFRIGVLASRSATLNTAVQENAGFSPMTSSNNWFVTKLFAPTSPEADQLMEELHPLLSSSFQATIAALDQAEIPYFPSTNAAQFVWLDLRQWLGLTPPTTVPKRQLTNRHLLDALRQQVSSDDEAALEEYLIEVAGVSLLPGETLSTSEPGFFRLCYTAVETTEVTRAIEQIAQALEQLS